MTGGWEYICAAYSVTWFILGAYALSLWIRNRRLSQKEKYGNF